MPPSAGDPVLHLLAGPNGSGKSTFVARVLEPATGLPFVNADVIAAREWPDSQAEHAYEASLQAAAVREELLSQRTSFITETVFSHASKVELVQDAHRAGYLVRLHVMLMPANLCLARVRERVVLGGHDVPEEKVLQLHERLWPLVVEARDLVDRTTFYDNTSASAPFRIVAEYEGGRPSGSASWPGWVTSALT